MVGYGLFDEKDNGFSGDFFNDVIAFLDFPMENVEGGIPGGDWDAQFQGLEPLPSVAFDGDNCNANSELAANLSVSCDETSRLEQLPNFVEEPSSGSIPLHNDSSDSKQSSQFQTSSPVSVLESSSSCSVEKTMPVRPETVIPVCPQHLIPLISSTASASENIHPSAASESFSEFGDILESHLPGKILNSVKRKQKKKKKKKLSLLSDAMQMKKYSLQRSVTTKKCMHCEVTKTPQWRNGPMGPKTLCNACGVRYRSGRLFPEYRPAASPTYVASLHSNSHKVVIEMRNNTGQDATKAVTDDTATDNAMSPLPEFIPMSSYLFD